LGLARRQTLARTRGHYPAPLEALRVIGEGHGLPLERALGLELRVAELVVGPVCKNLIRIFLLSERAKKESPVPDDAVTPASVNRLFLVGAGVMGGGIAELASRSGIRVRVRDLKLEALGHSLRTAADLIRGRASRRSMPRHERDAQLARITVTQQPDGLGTADAAIEAVVEDLGVKRRVFAELETRMRPDALLATNTSSLSVDELASGLAAPERFCGFHFFNPVHRMPLVEVVRGTRTSDATLVTAVALARRLGKTPVVVADSPGFVVNRILMPYLREAMHLLEEGYVITDIDASMRNFGMPMGPFEVLDEVGLDVAQKVAVVLGTAFSDRMSAAPMLDRLASAGRLGKKSGTGFYRHRASKRLPDPNLGEVLGLSRRRSTRGFQHLSERMVLAMVNEAAWCLDENVVSDPGMLDLAVVFGAGFPPFRGGPLRHGDALGVSHVASRLTALRAERGERYRPAERIVRMAQSGGRLSES
jgi:3-hydroxyacyl-CoA dehydrogenase/enoyl-CoA hydratase/3-hydroxybutyryl-CoA epimerase